MSDLSSITLEYRLACTPEQAFDSFAEQIGEWWHPDYTASADTLERVTIEPGVGGRVYESHGGGATYEWGEVTTWEPGHRLVHSFALAQDPANPSELSVEFLQEGDGCLVRFAHGGWTEANVANRKKFGDWPVMLDRFAALAQR